MSDQRVVDLGQKCTAIFTRNLTACSAFCVISRLADESWSKAYLAHMGGGPNPDEVNWEYIRARIPHEAFHYAIVANSEPTILTYNFTETAVRGMKSLAPSDDGEMIGWIRGQLVEVVENWYHWA